MISSLYVQDYRLDWKNLNAQGKATLILLNLSQLDIKYQISNSCMTEDNLTELILLLKNNNFDYHTNNLTYSRVVELTASLLSNTIIKHYLEETYIFPNSIFTWPTTINNLTLHKALQNFSNLCTHLYLKAAPSIKQPTAV